MRTVGLTGGIASGKSTVAALLRARGIPVLDADQVSRDLVEPGQPALRQIEEAFGPEILQANGQLDRKALGRRVVADPAARQRLEAILHPLIFQAIAAWLEARRQEQHPIAAVEASLMVETGSYRAYDELMVVWCPPELQVARLVQREGIAKEEARRWLGAQMPADEKAALATELIRNVADPAALAEALDASWARIGARAAEAASRVAPPQ